MGTQGRQSNLKQQYIYQSSWTFENVTSPPPLNIQIANIKTKSATIAIFSSPRFWPLSILMAEDFARLVFKNPARYIHVST